LDEPAAILLRSPRLALRTFYSANVDAPDLPTAQVRQPEIAV
jgi:hypothetical protein